MDPLEIILLVSIIAIAIAIWGGGTMLYCCYGFEHGLPFLSYGKMAGTVETLNSSNVAVFKEFIQYVGELSEDLKKEADDLPWKVLQKDFSVSIDMEPVDSSTDQTAQTGSESSTRPITVKPAHVVIPMD